MAEIAIGVIPLVGLALKSYQFVYRKIRVFRHYSRDVAKVKKQLERQHQFFLNECHLLLQITVETDDGGTVDDMIDDSDHPMWDSRELIASFEQCLGRNKDAFIEIVNDIYRPIQELGRELECFDPINSQRQPVWVHISILSSVEHALMAKRCRGRGLGRL
jgi:hypothetical protein